MNWVIEHTETNKLLMDQSIEWTCIHCGAIHKGFRRKKWTTDIDNAVKFETEEEANKAIDELMASKKSPRRRPKSILLTF